MKENLVAVLPACQGRVFYLLYSVNALVKLKGIA